MNWYRVWFNKNGDIVVAKNILAGRLRDAEEEMEKLHPYYTKNKDYIMGSKLMYNGH